ncbi:MAG: hypothetical protein ACRD6B_15915 [Bryobacteraceae bacterium]
MTPLREGLCHQAEGTSGPAQAHPAREGTIITVLTDPSLNDLADTQAQLRQELAAARAGAARLPVHVRLSGYSAAGGAIDLGSPASGRTWFVRSLVITGTDPTLSIAGSAYVYVGSGQGPAQLRDIASVHEHLQIVFSGVSAPMVVSGAAEDWPDAGREFA